MYFHFFNSCTKSEVDENSIVNSFLNEATRISNDLLKNDALTLAKVFDQSNLDLIEDGKINFSELIHSNLGINVGRDYQDLVSTYNKITSMSISNEELTKRLIEGTLDGDFNIDGFTPESIKFNKCCGQSMFEFVVSFATTTASCIGCPVSLVSCGSCAVGAVFTYDTFHQTTQCGCWS